jgi:hypothetical protein
MRVAIVEYIIMLLLISCTSDNIAEKYPIDIPGVHKTSEGLIGRFPLDGSLENVVEDGVARLLLMGAEEEYVEGGLSGTPRLRLNGVDNYLVCALGGEIPDTLSVLFWVQMHGNEDESLFRGLNPHPVWLDYGDGTVKIVVDVDATTAATCLRIDANRASDSHFMGPCATYSNQVFFYVEITSETIICWQTHSEPPSSYSWVLYQRSGEYKPPLLSLESDMLYIGRSSTAPFAGTYIQGTIEDIRIYNRHLTEEELRGFEGMNSKKEN